MKNNKIKKGRNKKKIFIITILCMISIPAVVFLVLYFSRPSRTPKNERLFYGVTYQRIPKETPRPLMIHVITVDLHAPGLKAFVTPGIPNLGVTAQTTSEFLNKTGAKIAINANYFGPHYVNSVFDYYPHSGDIVQVTGLAISMGQIYSQPEPGYSALCITEDLRFSITRDNCPRDTLNAVSGGQYLVKEGEVIVPVSNPEEILHPRSAFGYNKSLAKIWLVVVDGRQSGYSEGVSIFELAGVLKALGAEEALELDGGGSSTLGVKGTSGPKILNSPIEAGIFGRERPVANHLGFYVESVQ